MHTFSLCHATRRLHDGWLLAAQEWHKHCDTPDAVEHILCVDEADRYIELPPSPFANFTKTVNYRRRCAVDAWNRSAEESTGKVLITLSDDWMPCEHWDTRLLEVIPNLDRAYAVWVSTGGNPDIMTFSLLTRAYYLRYGYIFQPEFLGMYADNWYTYQCIRDGVVINCKEVLPVFEHFHPAYGTALMDDTYEWQHRPEAWRVGENVFRRLKSSE